MSCPFCDWSVLTPIIACDRDVFVIEPLQPVVAGHVLVIPRRHVEDFVENPTLSGVVMAAAAMFAFSRGYGDCNLITSRGAAATQSVRHLHVHVVPRAEGDGLRLPWSAAA